MLRLKTYRQEISNWINNKSKKTSYIMYRNDASFEKEAIYICGLTLPFCTMDYVIHVPMQFIFLKRL